MNEKPAEWHSTSPNLPYFRGLITQPYGITDTCMWQERLNFNCGKGLVDSLYSFDTTAVYVLCSQRNSSHAAHTLTPTLKWLKKNFLKQMPLTSKMSAWSTRIIHQNVGILVLFQSHSHWAWPHRFLTNQLWAQRGTLQLPYFSIINRPSHEISVKDSF